MNKKRRNIYIENSFNNSTMLNWNDATFYSATNNAFSKLPVVILKLATTLKRDDVARTHVAIMDT